MTEEKYIKWSDLIAFLHQHVSPGLYAENFIKLLETIPQADVEPVRHGRWMSMPGKKDRICSRCNTDEPYKSADENADVYGFCPHCGAKMDAEQTKEEDNDNH